MDISIRMATVTDAEQILQIYTPYVMNTAITFSYDAPSVADMSQQIRDTLQKYPFLVAVENESVAGYTYASAFKNRSAYDWAVETSIYIKQDHRGKGLGKKLYLALENILKQQNIMNLYACIAYTPVTDAHLDNASTLFHEHSGFKKIAYFTKCGYKFGVWYDMIWMEKMIGDHPDDPKPMIPVSMLSL